MEKDENIQKEREKKDSEMNDINSEITLQMVVTPVSVTSQL